MVKGFRHWTVRVRSAYPIPEESVALLTSVLLFQDPDMSEKLRQLGEPLRTGGSFTNVVLILLGLVAVVVFAHYLGKLQELFRRPIVHDEPMDLYCDLLFRLRLSRPQRQLMRYVARDLGLKNPAAILISEKLFDQRTEQWRKDRLRVLNAGRHAQSESVWQFIRDQLFPPS